MTRDSQKKRKRKRKKPATGQRVQETEYGPVVVVHDCKYKGRVGYYDDDEDEDINPRAIVYFGTPFQSGYVLIPRSWLRKTDVTPLALEKWKRENPELAKQCGVP